MEATVETAEYRPCYENKQCFLYSGYKHFLFCYFLRFLAFLYFYSTLNRLLQCCIKYTDIVLSIPNSVLLHCYKDINYYGCFYTSS